MQRTELEQKINDIKYDIETLQMEKTGSQKKLRFLKEKLIINISILIIFFLFLKITILGGYDNPYSIAFIVILKPVYYIMLGIYIVYFILKPTWKLYINCNLKSARKSALRRGVKSMSENIERCDARISALNDILEKYEEILIEDSEKTIL